MRKPGSIFLKMSFFGKVFFLVFLIYSKAYSTDKVDTIDRSPEESLKQFARYFKPPLTPEELEVFEPTQQRYENQILVKFKKDATVRRIFCEKGAYASIYNSNEDPVKTYFFTGLNSRDSKDHVKCKYDKYEFKGRIDFNQYFGPKSISYLIFKDSTEVFKVGEINMYQYGGYVHLDHNDLNSYDIGGLGLGSDNVFVSAPILSPEQIQLIVTKPTSVLGIQLVPKTRVYLSHHIESHRKLMYLEKIIPPSNTTIKIDGYTCRESAYFKKDRLGGCIADSFTFNGREFKNEMVNFKVDNKGKLMPEFLGPLEHDFIHDSLKFYRGEVVYSEKGKFLVRKPAHEDFYREYNYEFTYD